MHRFANPRRFLAIARWLVPLLAGAGLLITAIALYWGLKIAPPDYLQGESVRIIYVHVPAAWLGMAGFASMGFAFLTGFVWKHPLAFIGARAIAPVGAMLTAICLITGSIWGRPTWGTWWEWDGRLTSMLVLLFLYFGVIALLNAYEDRARADKAGGILALVGMINLPIIKFSVEWWQTLHQPASFGLRGSSIDVAMRHPLLVSALGFLCLFAAAVLMRMRTHIAHMRLEARRARLAGDMA